MNARTKTILINLLVAMLTAAVTSLSGVQIPGVGTTPPAGDAPDCPACAPCQCAPCPAAPDCDGAYKAGPDRDVG